MAERVGKLLSTKSTIVWQLESGCNLVRINKRSTMVCSQQKKTIGRNMNEVGLVLIPSIQLLGIC